MTMRINKVIVLLRRKFTLFVQLVVGCDVVMAAASPAAGEGWHHEWTDN